jgi:hypothetical protein
MKDFGWTVIDFYNDGFSFAELKKMFTVNDLISSCQPETGYNITDVF